MNNILTLIPDDSLDNIWDTFFQTLKERTIDNNLVLEGITGSGYRITFINLKLVKQTGGIYKAFVPAYIIGNSNAISPLPQIDNFDSMIFYGQCIDKFFDPQKIINTEFNDNKDIKINFNVLDNNEIEIEGDLFYFGINKNISRGNKKPNTPLMIKSYLEIKFKNRKNIGDVIEYYRKVCGLFKFLYNRKHVKFSEIKLISSGKIKDDELNEQIANNFKNTRNKISHGNMKDEILFSDIDIIAYVIVEKIVRCLVLYKAKVNIEKIKEIVDNKF